jgi:superfamily II DNA/RNA helicase
LTNPVFLDYLGDTIEKLEVRLIISSSKDKLNTLFDAVCYLGDQPGIIFCNFKDSIQRVSDFLFERGIDHGCFHGGLDQIDRERALIKFRNGTHHLLLATDLAARGLDIPEIKFIIHYHLPQRLQEFIHRNGRTARMKSDGTAYVIKWEEEVLPDFITTTEVQEISGGVLPEPSNWKTVFISGGRKDKISKGDIAGLFMKEGGLKKDSLGIIELKQDCAFAAVEEKEVATLLKRVNNIRLKKRKIRVYLV